jgi:HlyD family secretion protein
MKKKWIILLIMFILLLIIARVIYSAIFKNGQVEYQFVELTRGELENTISSTGTINPVTKVEVGTQVSGILDRLYVDFNDRVTKGQLLAVLDTIPLKLAVLDAEANLQKINSQLEQAQEEFQRNQSMFEKNLISESEFLPFKIALRTQQASVKSAEVNLQRAERNLKYAVIRSPISGIVIQRSVEAGQTVASSLQAPTLFIIAGNLSQMEIHAQVDESDIGQIKEGQEVRFTVSAYPTQKFSGVVRQIRLQPEVVSNVVNYTVVIDAANDQNLLLPGMTATVDFIIEHKNNALLVPNTALRFQPSQEEIEKFMERKKKEFAALPDSLKGQRPGQPGRNNQTSSDMKQVWFIDDQGKLAMEPIKTGITDGSKTEIVRSRHLKEGMKVINSSRKFGDASSQSNVNLNRPFGQGPRPF